MITPITQFTTVTIAVGHKGTDAQLMSDFIVATIGTNMSVAKIEVVNSFDDGRRLRFSVEANNDDTAEWLADINSDDDGSLRIAPNARMVTTSHVELFDAANQWPEDSVQEVMEKLGIEQLALDFNTVWWFPNSLLQTIVQHVLIEALGEVGAEIDDIDGVGVDLTASQSPSFMIWCRDGLAAELEGWGMRERIEDEIDVIADNVILSDWLDQMLEESEYDS